MESHITCPKCQKLVDIASYFNHEVLLCTGTGAAVNSQQVDLQNDLPFESLSPSLQSSESSNFHAAEEVIETRPKTSFRYDRTPEEYRQLFHEKLQQIRVGRDKVMDKRFEEAKNDVSTRLIQRYLVKFYLNE